MKVLEHGKFPKMYEGTENPEKNPVKDLINEKFRVEGFRQGLIQARHCSKNYNNDLPAFYHKYLNRS